MQELRARGMPLGLMPGMPYEEMRFQFEPGDCALLHSDGLAEAHARTVRCSASHGSRSSSARARRARR